MAANGSGLLKRACTMAPPETVSKTAPSMPLQKARNHRRQLCLHFLCCSTPQKRKTKRGARLVWSHSRESKPKAVCQSVLHLFLGAADPALAGGQRLDLWCFALFCEAGGGRSTKHQAPSSRSSHVLWSVTPGQRPGFGAWSLGISLELGIFLVLRASSGTCCTENSGEPDLFTEFLLFQNLRPRARSGNGVGAP